MAKPPKAPTSKPRKSGGKASPYDYTDGPAEIDLVEGPAPIANTGRYLNPESVRNMFDLVSKGVTVDVAATATGAAGRYKHWAMSGRAHQAAGREPGFGAGESPELFWMNEMNRAKAIAEANWIQLISAAAPLDWKAAAWLAERRAASRWHLQAQLQITAKAGEKIEISSMSTEKLMAIARGLLPEENIKVTKALGSGSVEEGEIVPPTSEGTK